MEQVKTHAHDLLYKLYGGNAPSIENGIYTLADHHCDAYNGGQWMGAIHEFNGKQYPILWPVDGSDHDDITGPFEMLPDMKRHAWGAAMTALVANQMSWVAHEAGNDHLARLAADHYHAVRDYVFNDQSIMSERDQTQYFKLTD